MRRGFIVVKLHRNFDTSHNDRYETNSLNTTDLQHNISNLSLIYNSTWSYMYERRKMEQRE